MIPPVGAATSAATAAVRPTVGTAQQVASPATGQQGSGVFGSMVDAGLRQVSSLEFAADGAVQDVATGGPTSIEDVMIATTQAQLGLDLLSRVRDRALEAYQEIMRMPL